MAVGANTNFCCRVSWYNVVMEILVGAVDDECLSIGGFTDRINLVHIRLV